MFKIKTFVFFDTEATGLPRLEQTPTKLTELAFIACSREHLLRAKTNEIPRVLHKLVLPVQPMKLILPETTNITGLDNFLLENTEKFNQNTAKMIICFLKQLAKPVCLVAHYGDVFDFSLLKKQFQYLNCSLDNELYCVDSWCIFKKYEARGLIPVDSPEINRISFKLTDIYQRLHGHFPPENIHTAEIDTIQLLKCVIAINDSFVELADKFAVKFNDTTF